MAIVAKAEGRAKSLWFYIDQYCLEDEGAFAWVCDEEDDEGLIQSCCQYI